MKRPIKRWLCVSRILVAIHFEEKIKPQLPKGSHITKSFGGVSKSMLKKTGWLLIK